MFVSKSPGQQDTAWNKWNWLIGEWVGEGSGVPGQGGGWFSLVPDLNGKILMRKNHSEYPATKDKPQTVHDDLMVVYPGKTGAAEKAIYFDNEGHVISYTIDHLGTSIVFTSTKEGNVPIYRLTYIPIDKKNITVRFEMSPDGQKFHTYVEGKCKRKS